MKYELFIRPIIFVTYIVNLTFDMDAPDYPCEYEIRQQFHHLSIHQRMALLFFFFTKDKNNKNITEFNVSQSNRYVQVIAYNYDGDFVGYYNSIFSPFNKASLQKETSFISNGVLWMGKSGNNCCVCGNGEAFEVEGVPMTQFEINGIKIIGYKCIGCHFGNKRLCSSAFKGETCKREIIKDNVACLLMCLRECDVVRDVVGVIGEKVVDVACCV